MTCIFTSDVKMTVLFVEKYRMRPVVTESKYGKKKVNLNNCNLKKIRINKHICSSYTFFTTICHFFCYLYVVSNSQPLAT